MLSYQHAYHAGNLADVHKHALLAVARSLAALSRHPHARALAEGCEAGAWVDVRELAGLGVPVVADIGSGLLTPHPRLPDEPDAATSLAAGADLVTASGDKLLGGPQAGLIIGQATLVERLRRHPLARALRAAVEPVASR